MTTDVNVKPGHGTAGRHPTRQYLDSLSGHDDPGMFGRMFPGSHPWSWQTRRCRSSPTR